MKKTFCIASLVCGLAAHAFALAGELKEPGIALPEKFPESARSAIMAALQRPDCKYVGGGFVNWFTTLKYGGDTQSLNLFLGGLVKCPGVTLSVRFQRDRAADECDWFVSHSSDKPRDFTVHLNMNSGRIKLEDLVIPETKGPPIPAVEK